MTGIIGLLLPVFAIVALGRAVVRRGWMDAAGIRGVNDFTYWIALSAGVVAARPPSVAARPFSPSADDIVECRPPAIKFPDQPIVTGPLYRRYRPVTGSVSNGS